MRKFNLALVGKWFWKMHVGSEGLWYKVLVARCGQIGGGCRRVGKMVMHCRKMCGRSVSGHGMGVGRWFDNNLQKGRLFAWKDDQYLWQSFQKYMDSSSHMDWYLLC